MELPLRPRLMGIVNVTPDSFSDGGQYLDQRAAIEHALRLVDEGADLIDIGGESARPYAEVVSADEELRRVMPVIERLCPACPVPVSIDTSKAAVAREAVAAGAEVVNDVSACRADPQMIEVALETGAGLCAMHMRGTPQDMQDNPHYDDVVAEVLAELAERRDALWAAGIQRERLCLDPGIGFAKSHQHSLTLMASIARMHELGCPVLVGHSRKSFIGKVLRDKQADPTPGTIGVALRMATAGVQLLRVHDVQAVRQALVLFEASGGLDGRAIQLG
jgi:dihydropteroate synthase